MSSAISQTESIVDLQGQPLPASAAVVLKALDRLLTVGAYYAAEHQQYLKAVEEACAVIVQAIAPQESVTLEIAANGLLIRGQVVDPHHRHVRKLHDLLVPLNIARLELMATLTPDDLRLALAALHEHRLQLGQAGGFREITIDNLPPTVSIAARTLGRGGGPDESRSLDEQLSRFADVAAPDGRSQRDIEQQRLASEFLELAARFVENLENLSQAGDDADTDGAGVLATPAELQVLRAALERLLEVRPDPEELLRLIGHAKAALDLSRDRQRVDLAFQILRKEMGVELPRRLGLPQLRNLREDHSFTTAMLVDAVAELAGRNEPVAPPRASARCDQLAVAFRLLFAAPDEPMWSRTLAACTGILGSSECGSDEVTAAAMAIVSFMRDDDVRLVDRILPPVLAALRAQRPELVAHLWRRICDGADAGTMLALWPHLLNDLLLGLDPAPQPLVKELCLKAGAPDIDDALALAPRVGTINACGAGTLSGDLFLVPPAALRPAHAVLMRSPLADRLGPQLHRALVRRPPDELTGVLVAALGEYRPEHRELYFALLREAGREVRSPQLCAAAVGVLDATLAAMPRSLRRGTWVPRAISWLARLDGEGAAPLLARIRDERRLLIFRAWPPACREAAARTPGED